MTKSTIIPQGDIEAIRNWCVLVVPEALEQELCVEFQVMGRMVTLFERRPLEGV